MNENMLKILSYIVTIPIGFLIGYKLMTFILIKQEERKWKKYKKMKEQWKQNE